QSEQCGWCKDRYGVSWQVVPAEMDQMLRSEERERVARLTGAFLKMKKFDVAALLEYLQVPRADLMGFSNGASIALQVAIRHPQRVRRLVFASSLARRDGAPPAFWNFMEHASLDNMPPPLQDAFLAVNPDPEALRRMHDRDAERMRNFRDVPDEQIRAVQVPVLVLAGDRDVASPEHAAWLARLFPRGRLMILPGGHGDYLGERLSSPPGSCYPQRALPLVLQFLDGPDEKQ